MIRGLADVAVQAVLELEQASVLGSIKDAVHAFVKRFG